MRDRRLQESMLTNMSISFLAGAFSVIIKLQFSRRFVWSSIENPLDNQKIDGELKRSSSVWSWWRSSITQNTDHFCKARTSLKLSGKSCEHCCADKVATGTLSQLTMDNGNEELRTRRQHQHWDRIHSVSLASSVYLESWLFSWFLDYTATLSHPCFKHHSPL